MADLVNLHHHCPYRRVVGVGGIGSGIFFFLEGNHDLGRNESRPGKLVDARDYCKLHIIMHYLATLLDDSLDLFPVGKVGSDSCGSRLLEEMQQVGLKTTYVEAVDDASTLFSVCYQYPDGTGGNITTSTSAASLLNEDDLARIAPLFEETKNHTIAIAVPEVPLDVRLEFLKLATKHEAFRVGSFTASEVQKALVAGIFELVDLISLNEAEVGVLVGQEFDSANPMSLLDECAAKVTAVQPYVKIIVSAGKQGAYGFDGKGWIRSHALPVRVSSTAGAGDALLAATLSALIRGLPFVTSQSSQSEMHSALDFGVMFASYSATSPHTIHPQASLKDAMAFADEMGVRVPVDTAVLCGGLSR